MFLKKFLFAISFISIATIISIAGYLYFIKKQSALAQVAGKVYYIDWISGLDTNDGLTKSTPWKRAPGMRGCSDNCLAYQASHPEPAWTTGAGNQFIFKGGVTWPKDVMSWHWYFGSGTIDNPIYFGVDKTWHVSNSWARPKFDAQGTEPISSYYGYKSMAYLQGDGLIVDNLEFTGLAQLSDSYSSQPGMLAVGNSSASIQGIEIKNCYFHGWSHGGAATRDYMFVLSTVLWSETPDMNLKIHDNVWDGSDTTKDMAGAYKGSVGHFYNNYIGYMANGVISANARYFWGNTFDHIAVDSTNKSCAGIPNGYFSFDCTAHGNGIENISGQSIIYNNQFITSGGGVTIWTQPKGNAIDYVFNNVSIDDENQGIQISNESLLEGNTAGIHIFNNLLQGGIAAGNSARISGPSHNYANLSFMTVRNNHLISTNNAVYFNKVTTKTESNNLGMTNAVATSAGYILSGVYTYYPPQGGATVDTGYDLTLFCSGIPSSAPSLASAACLSDATLGVNYNTVNHTVSSPARVPIIRSAWDIGAYEYIQSSPSLKGDFNSDSKVNNLDFTDFKNAFKSIFNSIFDINSDSTIDVKDFGVLMSSWLP